MPFQEINPTDNLAKREHEILDFWQKNTIFQKLREKNKGKAKWSFLDGPITANNPMGVHHAWGRTYKDLIQRYKAMQGFEERYQNGFDCQGLWVEVEVEKELGFKSKKDIEKYGIEKFVQKCKERALKFAKIQTEQSIRLGQWMDWENSYYTLSDANNYAIWSFLKTCHERGWIYKGAESVPWCPRCETAISQHEILTEDYQELEHESVIVKFPLKTRENEFLLVWTTTPWTLPANIAVAVDKNTDYSLLSNKTDPNNKYWLANKLIKTIFADEAVDIIKTVKGDDLVGFKYESPFDGLENVETARRENPDKFHSVVATDNLIMPISTEEGTGMVHTAVSAGVEDFRLGKKLGLPMIAVIADNADYLPGLGEFSAKNAKTNPRIILDYLEKREKAEHRWLFRIFKYKHRYPACWRCKTELVWKVADEWYIAMDKTDDSGKSLRKQLISTAHKIKWLPSFGLERELDWLNNMQDWLISKKRYWGLALPIYECKKCNHFEIIGSHAELKEKAVEGWQEFQGKSPHRPWIDQVKIKCSKCNEITSRILDVGNPWLDAGIVPYSTMKYFEDKNYWKMWFPADFITESFPGQFKNWFYSLIAMSTVLEKTNPFKTVLGYALLRDENGREMHKSAGNAIWLDDASEKMGVDVMRWMFSMADPYENLNFGYNTADEIKRRFILIFLNVYRFFTTYANVDNWQAKNLKLDSHHILDKWILTDFNLLLHDVTSNLEKYQIKQAANKIENFIINDFSTWYLRRSRKRRDDEFYATSYHILINLTKVIAPFMPFIAERLFQNIKNSLEAQSVHLSDWPKPGEINRDLIAQMKKVRSLVENAHALRAAAKIRVRQPLAKASLKTDSITDEMKKILQEEINVKEIEIKKNQKDEIVLDTKLTAVLQEEGIKNDIARLIQELRKKSGLNPKDKAAIYYKTDKEISEIIKKHKDELINETNLHKLSEEDIATDISSEEKIFNHSLWLGVKK